MTEVAKVMNPSSSTAPRATPLCEDGNYQRVVEILKAMAHPLRWKILCSLGDRELSVGEIVERTGTSQSNISQHLEHLPFQCIGRCSPARAHRR